MADVDLVLGLTLTAGGVATDLNAGRAVNGYELESTTRGQVSITWRKQTASSPYVDGTYTTLAVRENPEETVNVWVYGNDQSDREKKIQTLVNGFGSPSYTLAFTLESMTETWTCQPSDYSIDRRRELNFVHMALLSVKVDRFPRVTRTYADSTTFAG